MLVKDHRVIDFQVFGSMTVNIIEDTQFLIKKRLLTEICKIWLYTEAFFVSLGSEALFCTRHARCAIDGVGLSGRL